jgi:hypothetical protein
MMIALGRVQACRMSLAVLQEFDDLRLGGVFLADP